MMSKQIRDYFASLDKDINKAFIIANNARKLCYDPEDKVEILTAENMSERVERLISTVAPQIKNSGLIKRMQELETKYGQDWRVAFTVALEVAQEKFCKFKDKKEAMEIALRVGLAYITNGIVASPLEGFTRLDLRKTMKGEEYFALYFSGPIRSAGTTAVCAFAALSDYVRKNMGYAPYDATDQEAKRMITELRDFHEKVDILQYFPSEEEVDFMVKHLPIQIDGEPTEKLEVSNYKDLPRVDGNALKNGVCLVMGESLSQKAAKFWGKFSKWNKDFGMDHWDFLEKFIKIQKKAKAKGEESKDKTKLMPDYTFIADLVAGRPVFTHPLAKGGFRLRYGRSRVSGFSAQAIHPATMVVLDDFIASGTQLKVERPGKASIYMSCDSLEGPIVKLNDGSVIFLETADLAKKYVKNVEEVLYLGDVLINYGDFFNRAHMLVPPGYCEEWWMAETGINKKNVDVDEAIKLCKENKIPLHPRYVFHWGDISKKQFTALVDWLKKGEISDKKITLPYAYDINLQLSDEDPKRTLEILGVPHKVVAKKNVVIEDEWAKAFLFTIGGTSAFGINAEEYPDVLAVVSKLSGVKIRDKSGTFIGGRMGRPEKAKMRKLTGSPQALFPVGSEGGRLRCFQSALEKGFVRAQFTMKYCDNCKKETIYNVCENCGLKTRQKYYCSDCNSEFDSKCEKKKKDGNKEVPHRCVSYKTKQIDIKHYFDISLKKLGTRQYAELIKGVRGTSNEGHIPENLVKGILRAKYGLFVNKDGTIRYDMTEMPITHFKPKEIRASVEKLKELGYEKDVYGKELKNAEQILELKPQDIILPSCPDTLDDKADDTLFKVCNFVDELLVKFYSLESFYNLKKKDDLIGQLVISMSPHTCAGIVGRIIGFSELQGLLAHPYFHSFMRRDCLGYNNYVSIKEDGKWRVDKIGEIVEKLNPNEKADNFGTLKKTLQNINVLSNPGEARAIEATKHSKRKLLKICSEDGRELVVTESHKIYLKGKKEKRAVDLQPGDKMMVSYVTNVKEKDINEIFLPAIFENREGIMVRNARAYLNNIEELTKRSNFFQRDSFPIKFVKDLLKRHGKTLQDLPKEAKIAFKRDRIEIPMRVPLDKELLEVLGLYIAEGFSRKNESKKGFYQVSISSLNKDLLAFIKKVFNSYFGLLPSEDHIDHVTFSSRIIYELFTNYFNLGHSAKTKRIPSLFLDLNKEKLSALLRGYFEGDGSVSLSDIRVTCDTVSEGLKNDLSFVLSRFGIFTKFYDYCKEPGPKVREFYIKKRRTIPKFRITKIIIPSNFVIKFKDIGFISERKNKILLGLCNKSPYGMKIDFDNIYAYPKIVSVKEIGEEESYCFNVCSEHNFFANGMLVHNCDGDESGVMLLMDALLNFSRKFLPSHRGANQDEPLVLTSRLTPSEVDDMVYDMDIVDKYPLSLYDAALEFKMPWDVTGIKRVKDTLGKDEQYEGMMFTHDTSNINNCVKCSAYKRLPTMQEKVDGQMHIAEKLRAVDESDVARLVIERHFVRDIKGNLRKFSMQQFRCVECNEKFRRPPLSGVCTACGGKLLFTIAEGSVIKYLETSLNLAKKYKLPAYLQQTLELTRQRIESVFGKDKEKQENMEKWFG